MAYSSLSHIKYLPTRIGLFLMRRLVRLPLPVWQKLGIELGKLAYALAKKRRRITEINIRLAFPELSQEEQDRMVKDVMINTVLGALESFYSWWADDQEILSRSEIVNFDILDNLKAKGGVIVIGGHYTTLDLSGRVMGLRKKVDIIYKRQRNKLFNHTMITCREPHYASMIEKKEMRTMIKRLKQGEIVWYAPDQDFGRKGAVFAPFFGIEAATLSNLAKLVQLTGASVAFYSHFRHGLGEDTRYIGTLSEPFASISSDDTTNAIAFNKALEDSLREHDPSQYFWVHKRYKTRPDPEEPSPYDNL